MARRIKETDLTLEDIQLIMWALGDHMKSTPDANSARADNSVIEKLLPVWAYWSDQVDADQLHIFTLRLKREG